MHIKHSIIVASLILPICALANDIPSPKDMISNSATKFVKTNTNKSNRIVVKIKGDVNTITSSLTNSTKFIKQFKLVQPGIEDSEQIKMVILETDDTSLIDTLIEELKQMPGVIDAYQDTIIKAFQTPNDPRYSEQWGYEKISAPKAWDTSTESTEIIVGVIDTGVDYTHEDLKNNMWTNDAELNGEPGVDDDGNGYIDDIYGIDTINNDSDPMDDHNHGTHVAGTIGAEGNNNVGVVGVNWKTKIAACKFLSAEGWGYTSDAVECINYFNTLKQSGKKVIAINNSWGGGGYSTDLYNAFSAAKDLNILHVCAAGNSGLDNDSSPSYPASYDLENIIAVAATDSQDQLTWWSNYGKTSVDLAAPGNYILSTTPQNTYATFSGTSMATPHVTGAIALAASLYPNETYKQMRERVLNNIDPIDSLSDYVATGGRLNVEKMLNDGGTSPTPPSTPNIGTGTAWIDHNWNSYTWNQFNINVETTDDIPVIIAGPISYYGQQGVVPRITGIGEKGFSIRAQEWDYLNQLHVKEFVSLLMVKPGRYEMEDGTIWEVGKFTLSGVNDWKSISFKSPFSNAPHLFLTVQTYNGVNTIVPRAKNVTENGFNVALFEEEAKMLTGHKEETIGYLAIYAPNNTGTMPPNGNPEDTGSIYHVSSYTISSSWKNLEYSDWKLMLQEDQSKDPETYHIPEVIDVFEWNDFVLAQDISSKGGNPFAIRLNYKTEIQKNPK